MSIVASSSKAVTGAPTISPAAAVSRMNLSATVLPCVGLTVVGELTPVRVLWSGYLGESLLVEMSRRTIWAVTFDNSHTSGGVRPRAVPVFHHDLKVLAHVVSGRGVGPLVRRGRGCSRNGGEGAALGGGTVPLPLSQSRIFGRCTSVGIYVVFVGEDCSHRGADLEAESARTPKCPARLR